MKEEKSCELCRKSTSDICSFHLRISKYRTDFSAVVDEDEMNKYVTQNPHDKEQ